MNTKLIKIEDTKQIKNEELAEAAQILRMAVWLHSQRRPYTGLEPMP